MVTIKSVTAVPDFKSPSRQAKGNMSGMSVRWGNAEDGLKEKQMDDFILTMGSSISKSQFFINFHKILTMARCLRSDIFLLNVYMAYLTLIELRSNFINYHN
ncbi:MAG: hypothetical protein CSA25_03170 [Desulfobacter postgatei]|uniref:Uncharacterized protein n=1 Tax=Desulfobacter postgatei TaxID=2293 RepID=A0A2G6MRX3_9BACT|nr:MAG: hypothetical protein CSA25_03170 [Desulfobacter postgatei]